MDKANLSGAGGKISCYIQSPAVVPKSHTAAFVITELKPLICFEKKNGLTSIKG